MATANLTVRMDADVKQQAEELFSSLGMNLTTAINVFVRQSIEAEGLPFAVRRKRPNRTTLRAMEEAIALAHDPNAKYVTSLEELRAELEK